MTGNFNKDIASNLTVSIPKDNILIAENDDSQQLNQSIPLMNQTIQKQTMSPLQTLSEVELHKEFMPFE